MLQYLINIIVIFIIIILPYKMKELKLNHKINLIQNQIKDLIITKRVKNFLFSQNKDQIKNKIHHFL
jgi:hypothetical protein